MKKILYFITLLSISIITITTIVFLNQKIETDFFDEVNSINITYYKNVNINQLFKDLEKYSLDNDINISQNFYERNNEITIYSTNIKHDSRIHLRKGKYPRNNQYIQNSGSSDKDISGIFAFPKTKNIIRIYNISQIRNVNYGQRIYVDTEDSYKLKEVVNLAEKYGKVELVKGTHSYNIDLFNPLYSIVILLIFILTITQVLYLIKENKRWYIYKLWGYGIKKYINMLIRIFGTCYLISVLISGACLALYTILLEQILIYYINYFICLYMLLFILNITVSVCFLLYINNINKRKSISSIKFIIFSSKLLVSLAIFMVINTSNTYFTELHDNLIRMNYWEKTKGIYRINIGKQDYKTNDLVSDDKLNKSIEKFFYVLEKKKSAFIMASDNFFIVHSTNGKQKYFYQLFSNTQNQYGEGGKIICVSKNYFKFNPVYSSNGVDITKFFSDDNNTLNVIVPEQLRTKENELKKVYLDYFYFKKVYLENMYNKQLGTKECKLTENDLDINFIYSKKGSEYFTYNFTTGNPKTNSVKDPIVILYDGKVNISELGAYATRCMYFVNDSVGNAYDKIQPYINEANASKYITATYSVYNELGDRIVNIRTKIKQIISIEITAIITSLLMTFIFVYLYYREKRYQLYLNYLFGYSFWTINRGIIAVMLLPTIFSGFFFYCFTRSILIIYYIITILLIEILFSYLLTKKMLNINKMEFLKNING